MSKLHHIGTKPVYSGFTGKRIGTEYIYPDWLTNLPKGVRPWGKKFRSSVNVDRKQVYLGLFKTIEEAVNAQIEYRKANNIPEPSLGRPKKKI